ncbi:4'-phosphopantetheinyl transferase family protein [Deefgea piscis]|uniref:4'-phosphopantetheinyl transferase family protein n=1 Tax=Deefgea piscis TaxID=2739061 RepID=UPI001C2D48A9|nr:4'-phosphopantetheinyl transferase superfamily protein [Deefgea piscis]
MLSSYFQFQSIDPEADFSSTIDQLNALQLARLSQIQNQARRGQFLSARALAQQLLHKNHRQLALSQDDKGRPVAEDWPFLTGLSWSHGQNFCAAALGQGRVGVDLETIRARRQCLAIAEQYFDPRETAWLAALSDAAQLRAFYTLWVAKEALLKALGLGLVGGLARFVLLLEQGQWTCHSPDAHPWYLQVWEVKPNVLLALASDTPQDWQQLNPAEDWKLLLEIA